MSLDINSGFLFVPVSYFDIKRDIIILIILNTNKTIDKKSAQNPYIRVFA